MPECGGSMARGSRNDPVKASKMVVFAEHPIRKGSETSEPLGRFIVSSPFDLWRRGGLADPILRGRFAKSLRQATWRPGFPRTPQKKFPQGGEERTAARCHAAPLGNTRTAIHVLRAARALFLQGSGAARAPSNNWVDPPAYGGPRRRWPARVCRERP